jgi:hypothetical protein
MGRGPKPAGKAKPAVARKSPKNDAARVRDLEKRLAEAHEQLLTRDRTGTTGREVSKAWSNVRDDGEPSPSILDECSRPGGRGATFSVDGCSRRSAEVPVNQSSFPSCLRTDFNRTLLLPTRGIATTLAGTLRS